MSAIDRLEGTFAAIREDLRLTEGELERHEEKAAKARERIARLEVDLADTQMALFVLRDNGYRVAREDGTVVVHLREQTSPEPIRSEVRDLEGP